MNLVPGYRVLKMDVVLLKGRGWGSNKIKDPRIIISEQTASPYAFYFARKNDQRAECFLANTKFD